MTVFNGETYLAEALESIFNQQIHNHEIIVVNDGSTDNTAKILHRYSDKIQIIEQSNQGPSAGRNRGLQAAQGDFIAILDADDICPLDKLQTQLTFLKNNPQYSVVMGPLRRLYMDPTPTLSEPEHAGNLGCALFQKSLFDQVGLFNPDLRFGEDLDWFIRAREKQIPIAFLSQVALIYRVHAGCTTWKKTAEEMRLVNVLGKSLQRRRQQHFEQAPPLTPLIHQENL